MVELAVDGIPASRLKQAVSRAFAQLDEAQYPSALLGLQELGHLVQRGVQRTTVVAIDLLQIVAQRCERSAVAQGAMIGIEL